MYFSIQLSMHVCMPVDIYCSPTFQLLYSLATLAAFSCAFRSRFFATKARPPGIAQFSYLMNYELKCI